MRKALKIAWRDYKAAVRTKGFIIGLVVAPIFMGGGAIAFALLKDTVDTQDRRVAVVDRSGLVAQAIVRAAGERNAREVHDPASGRKVKPAYLIEIVTPDDRAPDVQRLALSDRVRGGELHAFLDVGSAVLHPRKDPENARIAYHSKNPALDELRGWLGGPINGELRSRRVAEARIDETVAADLFDWMQPEGLGLVSADPATGAIKKAERRGELEAIIVPLVLPMLLFLLVMVGGMPLLHSVMEEKAQRIAEVMLGSVSPFHFAVGKLIGGACVSLTGAAIYVTGGLIAVSSVGLGEFVPYQLLPWFFAYLVFSMFMFGALFAALGSACNDASEAQSVMFPAMLPLVLPMFVQMPIIMHPQAGLATVISLLPPFTPLAMLMRLGTLGGIPWWQPWAGLLGVCLCTVLLVWAGGRVFRVAILMQGTPPKLRNLVRWALRG